MSEEIDTHVNVKELVNEIITAATETIKMKKIEEIKQAEQTVERWEEKPPEKQYKVPPYSRTGNYPCVCDEFDCTCEMKKSEIDVGGMLKTARVAKKHEIKLAKQNNIGTQYPEELEAIKSPIEGGFCTICGLNDCICEYIQENETNDVFIIENND